MPRADYEHVTLRINRITMLGLRGWAERLGRDPRDLLVQILQEELARECERRRVEVAGVAYRGPTVGA